MTAPRLTFIGRTWAWRVRMERAGRLSAIALLAALAAIESRLALLLIALALFAALRPILSDPKPPADAFEDSQT